MIKRPIHFYLIPLFAFLCLALAGSPEALCGTASEPEVLMSKAEESRKALYESADNKKYRHRWLNCIKLYQDVYTRYPSNDQAARAIYRSAELFLNLYRYSGSEGDLDEAVRLHERLIKEHATHRLADDSQYLIGEIYYKHKNDPTRAYVEFLKVDIKFPSGDMQPKAREMLDKLAVILKKKDTPGGEKAEHASETGLNKVKDIRYWSTPTYTRVVIDLEKAAKYTFNRLEGDPLGKNPERLYVDIENTYVGSGIEKPVPMKDGLLKRARAGQYNKNTVRVVLDIDAVGGVKTFPLHDPFRIVVDMTGTKKEAPADKGEPADKLASRPQTRFPRKGIRKANEPDTTVSLAGQLGLSVKRIVLDPGHGGRDPGTYLNGGIQEKDIVLSLAKALASKIERKLGCEVILTRESDVFLPLERRTALANMNKADLFISLHVNAHAQEGVAGVETYFLNMATDERAVMVAARENATSEKHISDLQSILNDLMLNTKITESSKLAHEVQAGMTARIAKWTKSVKSLGVKQAPFYVLIGAEMPAILVETGFITNPAERSRLLNEHYRGSLADGIVSGIESYIKHIDLTFRGG